MGNERNVFEWRRFGHWSTSAAKARLSAFLLWNFRGDASLERIANECGHQIGDADLAVLQAFQRDSAVALELIVKAVIAADLEARCAEPAMDGVPATHDIPTLWKQAGLPELPREDLYRLHMVKSVLLWSGRYATPRTVKAWEDENRAFEALETPPSKPGRFAIRKPITFDWSDFDRLYQVAAQRCGPRRV